MNFDIDDFELVEIRTESNCQVAANTVDGSVSVRVEINTDAPESMRYDAIMREIGRRLEPSAAIIGEADSVSIVVYA